MAAVARLAWAYLRTELYPGDPAWQAARDELAASPDPLGRVVRNGTGRPGSVAKGAERTR